MATGYGIGGQLRLACLGAVMAAGAIAPATRTGSAPFAKSSRNTRMPKRRPKIRPTLVAPMLPLPWLKMSTPRERATR